MTPRNQQNIEARLARKIDPSKWHQHPNGGGWVEEGCEVSAGSFVDKHSIISSDSKVIDLKVIDSTVSDSTVSDSTVSYSKVSGSKVSGSTVSDSTVSDSTVSDSKVSDSTVSGNVTTPLPPIPVIPNIHQCILDAVRGGSLEMGAWHTCGTTHCRGGWVTTKAGEAGAALEKATDTEFAAMAIYRASSPIPVSPARFYDSNKDAMKDIIRCAEEEKALAPE